MPTDSDYWPSVLGEFVPVPSLGDVELVANGLGGFDLGDLEPNTHYTIHHPDFDGVAHDIEFTTGDGTSSGEAPPKTSLASVNEVPPSDDENSELCQTILQYQNCFDTGNPRHFHLSTGESPRAWLVQIDYRPERAPIVMPSECIPSVWSYSEPSCFRVGVVTEHGPGELSEWHCDGLAEHPSANPQQPSAEAGSAAQASEDSGHSKTESSPEAKTPDEGGCTFAPNALTRSSITRSSTGWIATFGALALYGARRKRRGLRAA